MTVNERREIERRRAAARQSMVMMQVLNERARQNAKWGPEHHLAWTHERALAVLMEEVGEAAKAANEGSSTEFCDEMIQVAAVAIAAVEGVLSGGPERRTPKRDDGSPIDIADLPPGVSS